MMEAISGDGQSTNTNNFDEDENAAPDDVSEIMSVDTAQEVPSNANNIRIRSKKYLQHMESNNAVVERDRGKHDNDEEGGKFSSVLNDKEGAGGMSGAGGEDGGLAASAVERSAVGGVSGVGAGVGMNISGVGGVGGASQAIGGGSNVGGPSGVGGDLSGMVPSGEDLVVPSRVAVKQFSARRSQDAKKKEEMEIRRKR